MKQSKNKLTLALIISSISLLLVLQVFWLTNSYEKAFFDLRKETNGLFRNTVFALRDSMFVRNIQRIPADSNSRSDKFFFSQRLDTVNDRDKNHKKIQRQLATSSQIRIYVSSPQKADSIQAIVKPLASKFRDPKMNGESFIVSLQSDSLSLDSIKVNFEKVLAKAGVRSGFKLSHSTLHAPPIEMSYPPKNIFKRRSESASEPVDVKVFSNEMKSDWVQFDPIHRYGAVLSDFRPTLLKEITPQILFSSFLTLVTIAAFVMLYRNIRSQQRLMELKNDFISNMTHELKTPIATVSVALEALKNFNGIDNPKLTNEYLDIAQHELNRLTTLTDKVLKTSLFEDRGVDFISEPVDLGKLIQQVIASLQLVSEKQKGNISFQKEGKNFIVHGGTVHLTNVIYNLLDNALKYSPINPSITVTLKDTGDQIIISVKDRGLGIASEFQKKIFEKFFRVPSGDIHNIKGYGLGLSYVDSVIKSHQGKIEVESEEGLGSTFTIALPKSS
jgi:two-component system, OmpR family, phosphate regulon sensor histidine kinase PhoR